MSMKELRVLFYFINLKYHLNIKSRKCFRVIFFLFSDLTTIKWHQRNLNILHQIEYRCHPSNLMATRYLMVYIFHGWWIPTLEKVIVIFVTSFKCMSRLVGKPTICTGENKGADQLRGNREADQRLCFRYSDSTIPLLLNPKFQASSSFLCLYKPVCVRPVQKPHCWFSHEAARIKCPKSVPVE